MSILQMSVQAGVLIVLIVLIRAVALNKLPKTLFLALWGIALFRLLVPISLPSQFGVYRIIGEAAGRIAPNLPVSTIQGMLPMGNPTAIAQSMTLAAQAPGWGMAQSTILWLAGMLAVGLFFAGTSVKDFKVLRFALPITDHAWLNQWLSQNKGRRPLALLQSDRITTPVAVGIAKPRIILPKTMDMDDKRLMQYVLTHEYTHIRRFDMLWKLLMAVALCVHWFNPLVWVMLVLMNRDLELTCDERVLRRFGADNKKAYAYSLIDMAQQRSNFTPLVSGFSKNAAEERITAIMKYKKSSVAAIALALLLAIGATAVFAAPVTANVPLMGLSATDGAAAQDALDSWTPPAGCEQYGISYDEKGQLLYNGALVRCFWDRYGAAPDASTTDCDYLNEAGTVDVHTLRRMNAADGSAGELTGIVACTQQTFNQRYHLNRNGLGNGAGNGLRNGAGNGLRNGAGNGNGNGFGRRRFAG